MQSQSISFTNHSNGGLSTVGIGGHGDPLSNGVHTMTDIPGEQTPVVNIQPPAPPAISVVTFRWDTTTAHNDDCRGSPDR